MPHRVLIYGTAASGKSYWGNSSWWDSRNRKPRLNDKGEELKGLWITFCSEDNPTLRIQEENRRRFTSTGLDDLRWMTEFKTLTKSLVAAYKQNGKPAVDSIIIDGFSEFDLLFQQVLQSTDESEIAKNQFHVWKRLMSEFFFAVQILNPVNTGANLIATARRGEVKKFVQRQVGSGASKQQWDVEEGEGWFDGAEAAPSLHGGFRKDIPHYFDYVFYTDTDTKIATEGPRKGSRVPVHKLYTMKGGDVYIKNNSEEQWLESTFPLVLENSIFPDFAEIVAKLDE